MKPYLTIFCTLAIMPLSADIVKKYGNDVIIPKALQSNVAMGTIETPKPIAASLPDATVVEETVVTANNGVNQPDHSIYDDDVIIPDALKHLRRDTPQETVKETTKTPAPKVVEEIVVEPKVAATPSPKIVQESIPAPKETVVFDTPKKVAEPTTLKEESAHSMAASIFTPKPRFPTRAVVDTSKVKEPVKTIDTCQAFEIPSSNIPNIEGVYLLNHGTERGVPVSHAVLVIEKLDADDFGYYYATQLNDYTPTGYCGIYNYNQEKNKFFHKTYKTDISTTLDDNVKIKVGDNQLEIIINIDVGQRAIVWNKLAKEQSPEKVHVDEEIKDTFIEAKNSYLQIYKKHPCFLNH